MKLVEIKPNEFNELISYEPNRNFMQSSNWGFYCERQNYSAVYLGYVDDKNIYSALGLFLIKNGFSLSGKQAVCPNGFLINYYDEELLESFVEALKKYLHKKGVRSLKISPNFTYLTPRGNNDYLISKLNKLGFNKTNDNITYKIKASVCEETFENIHILKADEYNNLFSLDIRYKYLVNAFEDNINFVMEENENYTKVNCLIKSYEKIYQYSLDNTSTESLNKFICNYIKKTRKSKYYTNVKYSDDFKIELIGTFETKV